MAIEARDIAVLQKFVLEEQGDFALAHVSRYVDLLREDKDWPSASLWSMVLAELYCHVEREKEAEALAAAKSAPSPIVLVKPA